MANLTLHAGNPIWTCLISVAAKTAAMHGVYVWAVTASLHKEYTALCRTDIHDLDEWLPKEVKHLVASVPAPITCPISSL